ncbi:hypothetical protein PtB15_13B206 [Puccinia triticina]|nr:hypothetical protein PtB15_13B206 [Puccinia triticina]
MVPSIQPGRRKIDPSCRPQYQKLIDGDSIYTCSKFTSEREPRLGDSIFRPSKKFKKSLMVEHGPWFLDLEPVLERRDQGRHRLWKRQKNKRLKRISSAARPNPQQAGPQQANSQHADPQQTDPQLQTAYSQRTDRLTAEPQHTDLQPTDLQPTDLQPTDLQHTDLQQTDLRAAYLPQADPQHAISQHANLQQADLHQADDEDADRTITLAAFGTQGTCSLPIDNTVEFPPRAVTPGQSIQTSDLLRSIHHEAATFYSSHNVLSIPTPHRGPRPKNWEEPIAMARALDGSALVAIGVLLEEIAKDQVESAL